MSVIRWAAAGLLASAATVGGLTAAAPAQAAPPAAPTALVVTVAQGEDATTVLQAVTLTCSPAGGTHAAAADACRTLRTVDGKIGELDVDPGPCTFEYNPVTVVLQGVWRGRLVDERATYGNPCAAQRALGAVYNV